MGAKDSKRLCLPYEEAVKRLSDTELNRIRETFKRLTNGTPAAVHQILSRPLFVQHVLGEGVPPPIADWLYVACGGTPRGIALRDLICGLALLTRGTTDERVHFLWMLYSNEAGTYILRNDFYTAVRVEGVPRPDYVVRSLFGTAQTHLTSDQQNLTIGDRIGFDHFRAWLLYNQNVTVLSKWLLTTTSTSTDTCHDVSTATDTPTFYQTLAGVTHLEESDICDLEKCFWYLQSTSPTGELDAQCICALVSPPLPASIGVGLFLALDVNRDGHVDFKELCCGISAACRGPTAERMKFCFKIFDRDRDQRLNPIELHDMVEVLLHISTLTFDTCHGLQALVALAPDGADLYQEDFLVWSVSSGADGVMAPLLNLLFDICHVSLGLKPFCRHHEYEIVHGWLQREQRRGYCTGQFWYLIAAEWWQHWLNYTTAGRTQRDHCHCSDIVKVVTSPQMTVPPPIEEGIVCDESLISTNSSISSTTNNSNSLESMGDSCSLASSSGVSSSSGTASGAPGPIDNTPLITEYPYKVPTLTGEGGRLKRSPALVQHRDFEVVPDSLWKALAHWYGGPVPLPRQVILPSTQIELELYPLHLRILRHHHHNHQQDHTSTKMSMSSKRHLTHTATFSRLSNVRQVLDFLCLRLSLRTEDVRLWYVKEGVCAVILLEDETATLQDLGIVDGDQLLLEVRNVDLTWPEEMVALAAGADGGGGGGGGEQQRRATICLPPGATGLHNLGNTCFMNAALQAVSNTRPLTMYFEEHWLCELNNDNPLGTKGAVAKGYAELCRQLWAGATRSIAPLRLRTCVTRHAPHLGGGGQHDSQELLAWLLDALHEDLNRVGRKRYTELKESGGRPDEVVAEEAWLHHLDRDHSIITDLFYGQLKSKVTCQTCGHESVRFDPFNLLSLPLPMESFVLCEVLVVYADGTQPRKFGVRLNSETAKYGELKEYLLRRMLSDGGTTTTLELVEVANCRIKRVLRNDMRICAQTATDLYAYQLPDIDGANNTDDDDDHNNNNETNSSTAMDDDDESQGGGGCGGGGDASDLPLAPRRHPPEVRSGSSALCMPNILCFKTKSTKMVLVADEASDNDLNDDDDHDDDDVDKASETGAAPTAAAAPIQIPLHNLNVKCRDHFVVAVHRKTVRQDAYFLTQQKCRPSLFGVPLLLGCGPRTTCQHIYEAVWRQVTRLLSPLPQSDHPNHATDCDDSLGYEFPFTLKTVVGESGEMCALCHWTQFCRGCTLPCNTDRIWTHCRRRPFTIAIDWDPTALHLRYQTNREKMFVADDSVSICRRQHTEPIDLDHCLRAFTSEEHLEAKYHCANCQDRQPATKKLQIWRLPPILIVHLKRFDYVHGKWVKTQKLVNFPFRNFNPTAYLASVPQQTILRHQHLMTGVDSSQDDIVDSNDVMSPQRMRNRLISTSLLQTPIIDEHLKDYHQHRLVVGRDHFDLAYNLYAVVSHSGLMNGGHYISYARNPNGNWYCYNDSSCREVSTVTCQTPPPSDGGDGINPEPKIDTSSAYILFYERVGLDYQPYLPAMAHNTNVTGVMSSTSAVDDSATVNCNSNDGQLTDGRQPLCSIQ